MKLGLTLEGFEELPVHLARFLPILGVARPAKTRPNGQIPFQNGGMAGL